MQTKQIGGENTLLQSDSNREPNIQFSPSGSYLASIGYQVEIWQLDCLKKVASLVIQEVTASTKSIVFASDEMLFFANNNNVYQWEWKVNSSKEIYNGDAKINKLLWIPSKNLLAIACDNRLLLLWDPQEEKLLPRLKGPRGKVIDLALFENCLLAKSGKSILQWELCKWKRIKSAPIWPQVPHSERKEFANAAKIILSDKYIASVELGNNQIFIFNKELQLLTKGIGHTDTVYRFALLKDRNLLISAAMNEIIIHDLSTAKAFKKIVYKSEEGNHKRNYQLMLSPSKQYLWTWFGNKIQAWDTDAFQLRFESQSLEDSGEWCSYEEILVAITGASRGYGAGLIACFDMNRLEESFRTKNPYRFFSFCHFPEHKKGVFIKYEALISFYYLDFDSKQLTNAGQKDIDNLAAFQFENTKLNIRKVNTPNGLLSIIKREIPLFYNHHAGLVTKRLGNLRVVGKICSGQYLLFDVETYILTIFHLKDLSFETFGKISQTPYAVLKVEGEKRLFLGMRNAQVFQVDY